MRGGATPPSEQPGKEGGREKAEYEEVIGVHVDVYIKYGNTVLYMYM